MCLVELNLTYRVRLAMEGSRYGGDTYSLGIDPTQWSGSLTWRIPALE